MKRTRKTTRVRKSLFQQLAEKQARESEEARLDAALASGDAIKEPGSNKDTITVKLNPAQIKQMEDLVRRTVAEREKEIIGDLTNLLWDIVYSDCLVKIDNIPYLRSSFPDLQAALKYFEGIGILEKSDCAKAPHTSIWALTEKGKAYNDEIQKAKGELNG